VCTSSTYAGVLYALGYLCSVAPQILSFLGYDITNEQETFFAMAAVVLGGLGYVFYIRFSNHCTGIYESTIGCSVCGDATGSKTPMLIN
jgi:hypothetical protein